MKIIVIGTRGFPGIQGGVEKHCEQIYPELVKKGCEVTVLAREPYVGKNTFVHQGVKVLPLACSRNKFLEAFGHTFKGVFAAKRMGCDILHFHAIGPSLFIPLARILGLKVVVTNHGPDYERKKWNRAAKCLLMFGERLGSKWANSLICISQAIASNIKRKYNRSSTVIPNGVIMPEVLQSDSVIEKYGLSKGKYILAVGRFVPEKGFCDLIEAFEIASAAALPRNDEGDDWKLVLVGAADHEDEYSRSLKEKANKSENIILTGFLTGNPLEELYSHAGLFVLPSYHEGLPIVLLEAMSYGLSCIASDIAANKEVGLGEGRFFKAGDTQRLAVQIKEFSGRLLTGEERKKQLDMVAQCYNWQRIADKTLWVYERVWRG